MYKYEIEMMSGKIFEVESDFPTVIKLYLDMLENNGFIVGDDILINLDDISTIIPMN